MRGYNQLTCECGWFDVKTVRLLQLDFFGDQIWVFPQIDLGANTPVSFIHHLPLQLRLIATVAAALVITTCLSVVPIYWHAKSKVATEMQAALAVGEQVAKNEIQSGESSRDLSRRLDLMVAHFNGDRHLKAKLITSRGGTVVSSRLARSDNTAPKWFQQFLNATPLTTTLVLQKPLEPLYAVVIEADPTNEVGEAWQDLSTFAGLLTLFCLLVLGSVSWIVTRAMAPIQSLLSGYGEIGAGNLKARVTPSGSAELERLCYGFNEMGSELEHMAARNTRLTQQLEDVQDEERADLARDLHDEVSPLLFAADVDAAMISKLAKEGGHNDIQEQTHAIRSALKHLKKTVTLILGRLRPAVLLDQGLTVAIDNLVSTNQQRHPNVSFVTEIADLEAPLSTISAIFFVIREAVANALRHGQPGKISIHIQAPSPDTIRLRVEDDGRGLTNDGPKPGFGMRGMDERIKRLSGSLTIAAPPSGQGVRLEATIPNALLHDVQPNEHNSQSAVEPATQKQPHESRL